MNNEAVEFAIRPATRQGVKPLICLYSESGCGKTMSALLLARGMAGGGKMVMVDTESGRGELYADVPPMAPYDCLQIEAPFTPARYIGAIDAVERSGAVKETGSTSRAALGLTKRGVREGFELRAMEALAAAKPEKGK